MSRELNGAKSTALLMKSEPERALLPSVLTAHTHTQWQLKAKYIIKRHKGAER